MVDSNGRTHEPNLRELCAELDGFRRLMEERDQRYEGRFRSQDEKNVLALAASKEAIAKAERATEKRFDSVNEFRGAMDDQAKLLMPRDAAEAQFNNLRERIEELKGEVAGLRESRSAATGAVDAGKWIVVQTIAIVAALAATGAYVVVK